MPMRLTTLFAGAGAFVAVGFLSSRILDLEREVALLEQNGNAQTSASPATSYAESINALDGGADIVEVHLQALLKRLVVLESAPHRSTTNRVNEGQLREEQAILSVIERESTRVRGAQLDWHKAHWLDARKQQLAAFADAQQLKPAQTSKLTSAIENELNALVEVMKRPSFAEEPDEVANDWLGILSETDRRAQEVLEPEQYQIWQRDRFLGRKLLWPWLPDKPKDTVEN